MFIISLNGITNSGSKSTNAIPTSSKQQEKKLVQQQTCEYYGREKRTLRTKMIWNEYNVLSDWMVMHSWTYNTLAESFFFHRVQLSIHWKWFAFVFGYDAHTMNLWFFMAARRKQMHFAAAHSFLSIQRLNRASRAVILFGKLLLYNRLWWERRSIRKCRAIDWK